jgi:hypothetical protein
MGASRAGLAARFERWLMGALVLHAGALVVVRAAGVALAPRSSHPVPAVDSEVSVSLDLVEGEASARGRIPLPEARVATARPRLAAASVVDASRAVDSPGRLEEPALVVGEGATPPAAEPAPRRLSLEQLGVGVDGRGALLAPPTAPSVAERVERRLQDSMLTGLALGDSAKGLGIEGPAVRAVTDLVLGSDLPLATSARLLVVASSDGLTRSVSVLESGADEARWQGIADGLRRALAALKLRMPAGSAGVSFQLVVTSRALLASGAEPTLETEVFGNAKREGGTPPAGRVSLLPRKPATARAQFPQLEGSHPQPWAGFTTNIGLGSADLSDLNSQSQRIVTARLAELDVRVPAASCPGGGGSAGSATAGCSATPRRE